jgi:uncharacterized protein
MFAIVGFDWDDGNRAKCQAHGLTIETIERLFDKPMRVMPDIAHSAAEERFKAVGVTAEGRKAFLVFAVRHRAGGWLIRPISARYMHRKEVEAYEKAIPDPEIG